MAKTVSHAFDSAGYRNFRESRSRKQATRQVPIRGFRGFSDEMKPVFGEFAGDFDMDRIREAYNAELQNWAPDGVVWGWSEAGPWAYAEDWVADDEQVVNAFGEATDEIDLAGIAGRFDNTRRATRRKQANDVDGLLEILQEFNLHTFFELDPYDLRDGLYLIAFGICDFLYDTGRQDLIPDELNYRPSPLGGDSESYEYQMAQEYAEQYGYGEFPRYLEALNKTLDALDAED